MRALVLMLGVSCLALSACDQDRLGTSFRTFSAKDGQSITIDAHQRAIITTQVFDERGRPRVIYCAEPSPDAFASINSSLDLSIAAAAENKGSVSVESLEELTSAASDALNARNATIQLLRDGLYRACEAYATGALTKNEYVGIVGQYQNVILALLSIELLTTINVREQHPSILADGKNKKDDANEDDANIDDSDTGELSPMVNVGLTEGSIKIIAQTADSLVREVLKLERQRALQPRLAECLQATLQERYALRDEIVAWCEFMLGKIAKDTFSDSGSETDDAVISTEELAQKLLKPDGEIDVNSTQQVHFVDGEQLQVFAVEIADDGTYEINLTDEAYPSADPALILVRGDDLDIVADDDDSGSGLNSRMEVSLKAGRYLIHVLNLEMKGATFELTVERSPDGEGDDQAVDDAISEERSDSGQETISDTLLDLVPEADTDIPLEDLADKIRNPDGTIVVDEPQVVHFEEGEELKVFAVEIDTDGDYDIELMNDMDLSGADPALIVVRAHDLEIIAHDDDSGSGLNSHVAVTLQSGRYLIHAMSLEREAAKFRLSIKRSPDGEGDDQAGDDAISKERSNSGDEIMSDTLRDLVPEADTMKSSINVGVKRDIRFAQGEEMRSFEFDVSVEGDYVLTALSESEGAGDPAIFLMDWEGDIVGIADDSGGDLNARLEVRLSAGSYELVIVNMDGRAAMFEVLVQNVDEGDRASNEEQTRYPYLMGKHEGTHSELSGG